MEHVLVLIILTLTGLMALRLVLIPVRLLWRMAMHAASGFLCLWILNSVSGFTGLLFPLNAATVAAAGFLGVPGMALMALLQRMG